MPRMHITNRTKDTHTWAVWNSDDTLYWATRGCQSIHPGQTHNLDVKPEGFKLYYLKGSWSAAGLSKFGGKSRIVRNPNAKILIQGLFPSYVDWDPAERQYIQGRVLSEPDVQTSLSQGALVAASSIKAVAEVMKFMPGVGTAVSGLLAVTSNIADALGRATTSSKLSHDALVSAVKEAVKDVVRSENDRQTAENAASTFTNAANYLSSLDGNDFGPHELKDLKANTEDFVAPGRDPMNHLRSMNEDVDKAKYITSAYLLGISAYLRYLWFHFLISVDDGDAITAKKLMTYRDAVKRCVDGLRALRTATESYVRTTMNSTGVVVDPEAAQLRLALYMSEIGLPDLTSLDAAIADTETVWTLLNEDVELMSSGQPPQHVLKSTWSLGGG